MMRGGGAYSRPELLSIIREAGAVFGARSLTAQFSH